MPALGGGQCESPFQYGIRFAYRRVEYQGVAGNRAFFCKLFELQTIHVLNLAVRISVKNAHGSEPFYADGLADVAHEEQQIIPAATRYLKGTMGYDDESVFQYGKSALDR